MGYFEIVPSVFEKHGVIQCFLHGTYDKVHTGHIKTQNVLTFENAKIKC